MKKKNKWSNDNHFFDFEPNTTHVKETTAGFREKKTFFFSYYYSTDNPLHDRKKKEKH